MMLEIKKSVTQYAEVPEPPSSPAETFTFIAEEGVPFLHCQEPSKALEYAKDLELLVSKQIPFTTQMAASLLGGKMKKQDLQIVLEGWVKEGNCRSKTYHNGKTVVFYPDWKHLETTKKQISLTQNEVSENRSTSKPVPDQDCVRELLAEELALKKKNEKIKKILCETKAKVVNHAAMPSLSELQKDVKDLEYEIYQTKKKVAILRNKKITKPETRIDIEYAVKRYQKLRETWRQRRNMVLDILQVLAGEVCSTKDILVELGMESDEVSEKQFPTFPANPFHMSL